MSAVKVAVIQLEPSRPVETCLSRIAARVEQVSGEGADLIVLPEGIMHDFGLPDIDLAAVAEPLNGRFVSDLVDVATKGRVAILAGMWEAVPDGKRVRNTAVVVNESGVIARYQKAHLFDSFGFRESDFVEPGPAAPVHFELNGLRFGITTCYDVRFPELYSALAADSVDAICVIAGWVAGPGKVDHWQTLLRARAIETTSYVIGADLCGPRFAGHSGIWDPFGIPIATAGEEPELVSAILTTDRIAEVRAMVPSLQHKRFDVAPATSK